MCFSQGIQPFSHHPVFWGSRRATAIALPEPSTAWKSVGEDVTWYISFNLQRMETWTWFSHGCRCNTVGETCDTFVSAFVLWDSLWKFHLYFNRVSCCSLHWIRKEDPDKKNWRPLLGLQYTSLWCLWQCVFMMSHVTVARRCSVTQDS